MLLLWKDAGTTMKMKEEFIRLQKEYIYDQYYRICDDIKDYHKITRSQMLDQIFSSLTPETIIGLCTEQELRFLQKSLDSKKAPFLEDQNARSLHQKFLFSQKGIPDEVITNVKLALNRIDWNKKHENEKMEACLIGLVRMMNSMHLNPFYSIASFLLEMSEDDIYSLISQSKLFQYEVGMEPFFFNEPDKDIRIYYENDYFLIEEVDKARQEKKMSPSVHWSLDSLRSIFYNGFDITKPEIKELVDYMNTRTYPMAESRKIILYELTLKATALKDVIKRMQFFKWEDPEFLSLLSKAYPKMPCAALNGASREEYEQFQRKEEEVHTFFSQMPAQGPGAHLSEKDVRLFYRIYFGLLNYTNQKYQLFPLLKLSYNHFTDRQKTIQIIHKFWTEKNTIIDEYTEINPSHFSPRILKIVNDFRYGFHGRFVLAAYERNYALFLDDSSVYMVKGLTDNPDHLIPASQLPTVVETAILPFQGQIVYDGMLPSYPVHIGPNIKQNLIREIKEKQKIFDLKPGTKH